MSYCRDCNATGRTYEYDEYPGATTDNYHPVPCPTCKGTGGLTRPQKRLLERLRRSDLPVRVAGSSLLVAERLERMGLAKVTVGGSGVAFKAPWWWQAVAR